MNLLVFDIETIPDIETGRRLYNLQGLDDADVVQVLYSQRRQETGGVSDFLKLYMHRVVAISVVLRSGNKLNVWSLGEPDADEKDIIQRFYDGIDKYTPTIVSWNGRGFDLPVLHYRALYHGITAARYWETGQDDQSFKWNNYLNRFHDRHTDLMDVISGYEGRAVAPLTDIATLLGFPGKMGMSGDKVWDCYHAGDLEAIRNYCETDVLNTYLVYLRFELMRGNKTPQSYASECERLREFLREENKAHFQQFLDEWNESDDRRQ